MIINFKTQFTRYINPIKLHLLVTQYGVHLTCTSKLSGKSSSNNDKPKTDLKLAKPKKKSERFQKALKQKYSEKEEGLSNVIDKLAILTPKKPSLKLDLLRKLESHAVGTSTQPAPSNLIASLFADMHIEKQRKSGQRDKSSLYDQPDQVHSDGDFFSGPDMEIFDSPGLGETKIKEPTRPTFYSFLKASEDLDLVSMPPRNGFEEMIRWTRESKIWNFPIDNEQGVDENESNTGFHEHVFLNEHITDLPNKRPIRVFMDLVLNGLSRNPHMTATEKRESISWFVNYFKENSHLIHEEEKAT